MCEGLNELQKANFCHLDIKLENYVLDDDFNLKLIDFGFARKLPKNNKKLHIGYLGSKGHIPPEI